MSNNASDNASSTARESNTASESMSKRSLSTESLSTEAMSHEPVTVYTTPWCGDCQVAKRFLVKFDIPFEEVDIENDPAAAELVMRLNDGRRSVPTLVYDGDATSLSGFSRAKLDAFLQKHNLLPS